MGQASSSPSRPKPVGRKAAADLEGGPTNSGLPPRPVPQETPTQPIVEQTPPLADTVETQNPEPEPPNSPEHFGSATSSQASGRPEHSVPAAPTQTHPLPSSFLAALSEQERSAIERAQAVWVSAGGAVDLYTVVTMHRFCVGNKGVEKKIDAQIRKTVAWRNSSNAARYRAELIAGTKLCEYDVFMKGMGMISFLPYLGGTTSGLQLAEYV